MKDLGFVFSWVHGLGEKNKFGLLFIVEENEELGHLLQDTFIQSETYIAVVPVCANKKESSV